MVNSPYLSNTTGLEIAIIGMSGCFPGAKNVEEFWHNLKNGIESIHRFTDQELKDLGVDAALFNEPNYVKAQGALKDIDMFDASFFDISPREAEVMDPSMRFFLEHSWKALEDAGYSSEVYKEPIGVYAGTSFGRYLLNIYSNYELIASVGDKQIEKGNSPSYITTFASYKFNLTGPSYAVQTTCSSSLVAVHLACQSLLSGECNIALAGGVSISTADGYLYQEGGIESNDGHCRAFDAKAGGTVRGRGLGLVVLKPLEEAIADGDCIHAVIKGSAINNDGSGKVSYTAPSVNGQAKVIRAAQVMAEVEPNTISYIEAHGTGTTLGDPIEISALTKAFRAKTQEKGFCRIGSVKTNIGHLDSAAGVAGLIKTVLALKHQQIPPSLNFEEPSPQIDFANSPFYVNNQLSEWKTNGTPRRAGVSSFGFGGTNAHVILEEAPLVKPSSSSRPWQLLLLSAKTSTALEMKTENLANYLQEISDLNLADVAHTLQVGRWNLNHRRMLVCQDREDAIKALLDPQRIFTHYQEPCNRSIVFMFSGQGSQYVNMGRELYENETVFREQVDSCCELLKPHLEADLRTILYPKEEKAQEATQKLQQTAITQPALFVIEYALAKLWMAWGVCPEMMIGHSIGEYVAATLAGVFSLEDALMIVAMRGKLMQQLPGGAMLSIQLPEKEVEQLLNGEISLAASNAPTNCVVSGSTEAVDQLQQKLQQTGVTCRRLHTSHAFHSQMMEPIIDTFIQLLGKVKLNPPKIPFVSNVSGTWITAAQATDPNYWAKHLRQPIRFCEGIAQLAKTPETLFLEVGPGRTLSTFVKQHQKEESLVLTSIRHPREQQSDVAFLLNNLGKLWLVGVDVKWSGFYASERRHRIPLPTYPFEHQRYWIEVNKNANLAMLGQQSKGKKPDIADWFYVPHWKESTPPELFQKGKLFEQKSYWLVFVDTYGIGIEIAERLEQQGQDVIVVRIADKFAKLSDTQYTINPQQRDDYDALIQALQEQNWTPQGIAHFWSITPNDTLPSQELDREAQLELRHKFFENCQNVGFYSLLFLAQALGQQNIIEPIKLMVITSHVHDVTGSENLYPEKATILSPCQVIPQEYPNISGYCFDIELSQKNIDYLLAEFKTQPNDNVIAYRGNHRWVQTYEPLYLDENVTGKTRLREKGVYLITGGLGGVGLVLAEYLAHTVQAKLILIGRNGLPEKDEWSQWLETHDQNDSISCKIRKVQQIEAFGGEVLVISADVANEQQMHNAIAIATNKFGQINGVIHAAGNTKDVHCAISETSTEVAQSQFHPKVYGLFVLEKVLQGQELDFCQLTSSLASVLGGLGFISYSAANIFMDAFVRNYNRASSCPWSSINWDDWGIEQNQQNRDVIENLSKHYMTSKAGKDSFERLLSLYEVPQVIVSARDLQVRLEQWIKFESLRNTKSLNKADTLSLHSRPILQNDYIPARNEVEEIIAQIWQQILGIEKIGIYDNFFELGGDSLLSVQVISKANQIGLPLTPKQLFQHQNIAQLAAVAGTTQKVRAEQGILTGKLELLPIQHWFFEQEQPEPHHWNQSVLLESKQKINPIDIEKIIDSLQEHHDVLRLRFKQEESATQVLLDSSNNDIPLICFDFSLLSEDKQAAAIEAAASKLEASLNLSQGPLFQVALFDLGSDRTQRLLWIIHQLAIDGVSWRILLEDFQTAYQQVNQGRAIKLPPKTTSYQQWSSHLQEYARSSELLSETNFWLGIQSKSISPIPRDFPDGKNIEDSASTVSVSLSEEETQSLLQLVPEAYRTQINDILLTALVLTFNQWTEENSLLIDLEGDGREEIFEDVDLSRTVGWFTTIFPVNLDLSSENASHLGKVIKSIKEQLREIPHRGIGYGLLRYLSQNQEIAEQLSSSTAEVAFNYLGQFEGVLSESSLLSLAPEANGAVHSRQSKRNHLLTINSGIYQGNLEISWSYSKNLHRPKTIEVLAQNYIETLRLLIFHCQSPEAGGLNPSDFPLVKLDQVSLDRLISRDYRRVEDIYSLSPIQQGLLFHTLNEPDSQMYFEQLSCSLHGDLNLKALQEAWQQAINRHTVLRTAFYWQNVDEPVQVVWKQVNLPWQHYKWEVLSLKEQTQRLEKFLESDRQAGFNLSVPPVMRLTLIQVADDTYHFIWSYHHILMDGWAAPFLLKEVFELYQAKSRGEKFNLQPAPTYRNYIAWLQQQDMKPARSFWQQMLRGFTKPTPVLPKYQIDKPDNSYKLQQIRLSTEISSTLQTLARQNRITLNTFIQAIWALLLSHYSSELDVVFGATVSGRPTTMESSESIVGLFINTLPVRAKIVPDQFLLSWLQQLQNQQVETRQYEHSPLVQIHKWSDVPQYLPLFESIVVFQNYSIASSLRQEFTNLRIENVHSAVSRSNYPLTLRIIEAEWLLQILYSGDRFENTTIIEILQQLEILLQKIIEQPATKLSSLLAILYNYEKKQQQEKERELTITSLQKLKLAKRKAISE